MQRSLTDAEISARAYELWEQAGRPNGQADSHWFQAIQQLSSEETILLDGPLPDVKVVERTMAVGSTELPNQ